MHRSSLVLIALLPLFACDGGADEVEPKSGTWNYSGSEIVSNSCGGDPPTDPNGPFQLSVSGERTFKVIDEAFDSEFESSYVGEDFNCPERIAKEIMIDGVTATAKLNVSISGYIESSTLLHGTQTAKLTCEGSGTELPASTYNLSPPCEYSVSFDASAK